jgi:signal transduction histidine kinase
VKSLNFFNSIAFLGVTVALAWYSHQAHLFGESVSVVILAVTAWYLEMKAISRSPVDFSSGFVFYLALLFMGDGLAASLLLVGAFCVRSMVNRMNSGDLLVTTVVVVLGCIYQLTYAWPESRLTCFAAGLVLLMVWTGLFRFWNRTLSRRARGRGQRLLIREEHEVDLLRSYLSLYALVGSVLTLEMGWIATLAAPLCLVTSKTAENVGFRIHAQEATREKEMAKVTKQRLRQTEEKLAVQSERHDVLESVADTFSRPLTPSEAFEEIGRVTSEVVGYRSLVLFRKTDEGRLEPTMQNSPESDLHARANLTLKREPSVEKAWHTNRPLRGETLTDSSHRLIPKETFLVALPVKPYGILYFGRDGEEPFSKSEASRLWFIVQKAMPALLRADQDAQTQEDLREQSRVSRKLKEKVVLSSQLLEGAQQLLACINQEQVFGSLQELLEGAVPHQLGLLASGTDRRVSRSWGSFDFDSSAVLTLMDYLLEQNQAVFLPDLGSSRFREICPELGCLLAAPISGERAQFGILLVGCRPGVALTQEQRDFVRTCACLVGSSLTSLILSNQVEEAHQQVVQASKLSAIGQLAAGVAHELNTPLAAIGLALEAAQIRPEKSATKLERASDALQKAKEIVSGLLDYARHAGETRELIEPKSVIDGALDLVSSQLRQRKVKIVVQCDEKLDPMLGNMTDFQQVMINLMLNAADASTEKQEIVVRARQVDTRIELSVQDFGEGIPKEHRGKIFDPFFTTKPVGRGTGLGLSVCKQLVERHHGHLTYETEVGRGSTFTIKVPARLAKE